ncbi:hypothetical protein [Streptomyces sp. NPDC002172]
MRWIPQQQPVLPSTDGWGVSSSSGTEIAISSIPREEATATILEERGYRFTTT